MKPTIVKLTTKPVEIEAWLYVAYEEMPVWVKEGVEGPDKNGVIKLKTGEMAKPGHWILLFPEGVFFATREMVEKQFVQDITILEVQGNA